jgi:hypothetical protein
VLTNILIKKISFLLDFQFAAKRFVPAERGAGAPMVEELIMLLPRHWVVERSFGWMARFRRLARDYERLPETLAGLSYRVFAILMAKNFNHLMAHVL